MASCCCAAQPWGHVALRPPPPLPPPPLPHAPVQALVVKDDSQQIVLPRAVEHNCRCNQDPEERLEPALPALGRHPSTFAPRAGMTGVQAAHNYWVCVTLWTLLEALLPPATSALHHPARTGPTVASKSCQMDLWGVAEKAVRGSYRTLDPCMLCELATLHCVTVRGWHKGW